MDGKDPIHMEFYVVVSVQCVGSYVYVVGSATGGTHKTLNRASLLPARPPATGLDRYAPEDSLSDDDAILIVPEIATAAVLPGIVEAVPTLNKRATWWWW